MPKKQNSKNNPFSEKLIHRYLFEGFNTRRCEVVCLLPDIKENQIQAVAREAMQISKNVKNRSDLKI